MATITTDTFFDAAARTPGEAWTISGCTLTVRTDTRWHAGSPAAMTGTIGATAVSNNVGGSLKLDGTQVRWLKYTGGSGSVPAVGTTISQGGVTGYLLGVWFDVEYAPELPGNAMPSTGFLKFREVTGTFSAGALTGIGATAAGPDVPGWIEVVHDVGANCSMTVHGEGLVARGDWFELGTTSGVRGQQIKTPINGGGSGSTCIGVQIETAPGSGVYEWYQAVSNTQGMAAFNPTNMMSDARAKFVESMTFGIIRIGHNGTADVGHLPPAGCRIRMPNIMIRVANTSTRAQNVQAYTSPIQMNGANFDISHVHSEVTWVGSNARKVRVQNTVNGSLITINGTKDWLLENSCLGSWTASNGSGSITNCLNGTIRNCRFASTQPSISGAYTITNVIGLHIDGFTHYLLRPRTSTTVFGLSIINCNDFTISNVNIRGLHMELRTCNNVMVKDIDHIDRMESVTNTSNGIAPIQLNGCANVIVDGITFGDKGTVPNTQPYLTLVSFSSNANRNIKVRNAGTFSAPLDCGTNSSLFPSNIGTFGSSGDSGIKYQRCYLSGTRNGSFGAPTVLAKDCVAEDCYAFNYLISSGWSGTDTIIRKATSTTTTVLQNSVSAGCNFADVFTSATTGLVAFSCSPNSDKSAANVIFSNSPGSMNGFSPTGPTYLIGAVGDYVEGTSEWILGHTGFQNVTPTQSATHPYLTYYDLDTGSGFSGNLKPATGTSLAGESISPSGFRLRVRVVKVNTNATSGFATIRFLTTTTTQAQIENMYPLDVVTLGFEGLIPGSEVRAYVGDVNDAANAVEVAGIESTPGSTWSFTHERSGQAGYIVILAMGYQPVVIPRTYAYEDSTLLIQPVVDRNYYNPPN
jgi:hypothetical protein